MTTFPNAPWRADDHDPYSIVDAQGDKVCDVSAALYKPGQGDLKITNQPYAIEVRDAIIEASKGGQS